MANPNIVAVTAIYGVTTYLTPGGTTALVLLPNTASSGLVFKINQIVCANVNGTSAVNATVSVYTNGAVAQNGTPSSGTAYPVISTISVPASASVIAVDKTTAVDQTTSVEVETAPAREGMVGRERHLGYEISRTVGPSIEGSKKPVGINQLRL
jgi:hypothetical protein